MKIESLLNPITHREDVLQIEGPSEWASTVTRVVDGFHSTAAMQLSIPQRTPTPSKPRPQRQAKDAPTFRRGRPKGNVLFPPHEAGGNDKLAAEHSKFQLFPMGEIASYVHRIPYSSDKKSFLEKTGRDAFEGESLDEVLYALLICLFQSSSIPSSSLEKTRSTLSCGIITSD